MKEKKNIDRIFQEKFKDFEKEPGEKAWENIASKLDKKDRKRPLILPLWLKIGGVAAVMALILAGLLFTDSQNTITGEPEVVFEDPENATSKEDNPAKDSTKKTNEIVDTEDQFSSEEENLNSETDQMNKASNNRSSPNTAISSNKNNSVSKKSTENSTLSKKQHKTESAIVDNDETSSHQYKADRKEFIEPSEVLGKNSSSTIAASEAIETDSLNTESILKEENALAQVEDELKKGKDEEENIAEVDSKKMRLSTFAAPIFYKNIGSGNELSNQLANNSNSSEVTLSYGVKIAYKISNRLKIRTGISKIDINKNVRDISYSPSAMSASFENISPLEDNIAITDNSPSDSGLPMGGMENNNSLTTAVVTPGELNQQFGYIEIPLEMEYSLIDKKFGLNIIGGGSSLFLDNNRVQLISGEIKTDLGEATNINSTSFSTNIGLGMDYKLTDKFSISVEPIFKYQINTFDRVNDVQPVNFGVYSGLNFRF
ncbi:hypothetical protein [Gramella sp. MAR_2010_147]|uniref:outer membrane protein n=1 Tax=Gramella sp. MAR_2010_147 TaxID=1250205 RepID=UPI00087A28B5|nr:hypothetical protein [Gramella sp. MAR_2010_147]SDS39886.1 hypothetical protein SAMN04488553_2168 [Gramella sp. MAR_2010_147]